jgi:hypothetical protein
LDGSDRKTAKLEAKAFKAFRETPAGRARAAAEQGHKYFQISELLYSTEFKGRLPIPDAPSTAVAGQPRFFEEVEAEGWHLLHAAYVGAAANGSILGVYIFEAVNGR